MKSVVKIQTVREKEEKTSLGVSNNVIILHGHYMLIISQKVWTSGDSERSVQMLVTRIALQKLLVIDRRDKGESWRKHGRLHVCHMNDIVTTTGRSMFIMDQKSEVEFDIIRSVFLLIICFTFCPYIYIYMYIQHIIIKYFRFCF